MGHSVIRTMLREIASQASLASASKQDNARSTPAKGEMVDVAKAATGANGPHNSDDGC